MKSGRPPSYAGGSIEDMEMLKCYKFRVAFDFFLFAAGEYHLLGRKYLVVMHFCGLGVDADRELARAS